jgi:hypothetical protein
MRRILIPVVVLAAALSLAGCSSSGRSGSASAGSDALHAPVAQPAGGTASTSQPVQREVITTADVTLRAKNPLSAGDRAARIAEAMGGRVDDRTESAATKTQTATASLTLRVPADKVTTTLDQLKPLGTITSIKMSTDDVTTKGQDLDAKIKALTTSVNRLLALEAKAKDSDTLISFETAISDRQGQLDSLTAQRRYLSDQVAMSTISLDVVAPTRTVVHHATTPTPANAAGAGFAGFATFFTWVFLVLSYLLPWIVLAAVITFGSIALVRWRRRRRAAQPVAPRVEPPAPAVS